MAPTATPVRSTPAWYSFWKFSRPHTIVGTSASVLALFAIAATRNEFVLSWTVAFVWAIAWLACLCGNVYIVGLNQLEDVEIDKINKPHLPIAAGEFSLATGQTIVAITGILALLFAALGGPWLLATVAISLTLGTAYSLPPLRLKRFPFWASFCIYTVRGIVVNLGLFLHFNAIFKSGIKTEAIASFGWLPSKTWSALASGFPIAPSVWALTAFVLVFTFAIAIFKDIPDLEGDRAFGISTFTVRLGTKSVFDLARWTIAIAYIGTAIAVWPWRDDIKASFLTLAHLAALGAFGWRSRRVDLGDRASIASAYQFIWRLFFLEYLIFAIACIFARTLA